MTNDELLQMIRARFDELYRNNRTIKALETKLNTGEATYEQAHDYAALVGDLLKQAWSEYVKADMLPDGVMYEEMARSLLNPTIKHNYDLVAGYSERTQNNMNEQAGLGLKAIVPGYKQERTDGMVQYISGVPYEERELSLLDTFPTNSMIIVDEFVRDNFLFQAESGLESKIVREAYPKCCDWCDKKAGTYSYEQVKDTGNDVFRRHANCRCKTIFIGESKKRKYANRENRRVREDVWTHDEV